MNVAVDHSHFDVFNGDADGLCALQQLRLAHPRPSRLITGAKREHALLRQVAAKAGDSVTVLDLPLPANYQALVDLLGRGVSVEYVDHHLSPFIPAHPHLDLTLDPAPDVCTSLLVNRLLGGRFALWAAVGAFGDNLPTEASALSAAGGLTEDDTRLLRVLGECMNYNAYGDTAADLTIAPAGLYERLRPFINPLDFIEQDSICLEIDRQLSADTAQATAVPPLLDTPVLTVVRLPDAAWARRVVGSFANRRAAEFPTRVCAVLNTNIRGGINVSLRVPAGCPVTAAQLVRPFRGGGRAIAAGINDLAEDEMPRFIRHLQDSLPGS